MKLLITGGCGFLGSNLAAHAIAQGVDLCVFDSLYRQGSQENLRWLRTLGNFQYVHGDIRNPNDVERMIRSFEPTMIFHLAGQVAMTTSIADPRMDFEVNALGTLNLLEAVRQYAPRAGLVYSSTNKVYGDLEQFHYVELPTRFQCVEHPKGFDEAIPLDFHSPYGCSKGSADQYLLDYHRIFGLNTVVLRHSSMYGGRQFASVDQGWVGWFCQMAAESKLGVRKEPFTISGTGKQVRDVLHGEDMVRLYFKIAGDIQRVAGEAFNVGGGYENSLSLLELFELLGEFIEKPLHFARNPARQSDQRIFIADTARISSRIDWKPQVGAREGVGRMLSWAEALVQR